MCANARTCTQACRRYAHTHIHTHRCQQGLCSPSGPAGLKLPRTLSTRPPLLRCCCVVCWSHGLMGWGSACPPHPVQSYPWIGAAQLEGTLPSKGCRTCLQFTARRTAPQRHAWTQIVSERQQGSVGKGAPLMCVLAMRGYLETSACCTLAAARHTKHGHA